MDKHTAHYPLTLIRQLIDDDEYRFTRTARTSIRFELNIRLEDAIEIIHGLRPSDLYKSMTTHYDHKLWQDVYKPEWEGTPLYIKLQVNDEDGTVVISFKKQED